MTLIEVISKANRAPYLFHKAPKLEYLEVFIYGFIMGDNTDSRLWDDFCQWSHTYFNHSFGDCIFYTCRNRTETEEEALKFFHSAWNTYLSTLEA